MNDQMSEPVAVLEFDKDLIPFKQVHDMLFLAHKGMKESKISGSLFLELHYQEGNLQNKHTMQIRHVKKFI